ncbi:hypothetical protein [Streptomyces sp. NPDC048577]
MDDALVALRQVMSNQGIVLPDEDVDAYIRSCCLSVLDRRVSAGQA